MTPVRLRFPLVAKNVDPTHEMINRVLRIGMHIRPIAQGSDKRRKIIDIDYDGFYYKRLQPQPVDTHYKATFNELWYWCEDFKRTK